MNKEILFSLTAKDFDWEYTKGSGPGGQNRNKRETAVKCIHRPSGAVGQSCEERSQRQNREKAFERMAATDKFKSWHKRESARLLGILDDFDKELERKYDPTKILVEVKDEAGKWVKEEEHS